MKDLTLNNIKNKHVALGYCRVSTSVQAEDGLSLDVQEEKCRKAAQNDGYNESEVIIIRDEGKSGTKVEKRKGMLEVIELAKKREISILYMPHSDRMARSVADHTFLRNVLRSNDVELKYLNGQSSADDASSIFADNMFATINQYHSDITREKTQQATTAKALAGYLPTHSPIGYQNCANPDKNCEKVAKRIIVPDPIVGPLVTEAFTLYATGQYNGYELNDMLYEKGLTSRGKKMAPSIFYNMLKNRIYLGEIHWIDIHVKNGKHTPLTDEQTFNQVQKVLESNGGNRCRRRKYFWLLNGYMFCPTHKCRYTAEWHFNKGRAYYHCSNRGGCGKYVEKTELEGQVAEHFKKLQFNPAFTDAIIGKVRSVFENRRNSYSSEYRGLLNQDQALEAKLKTAENRLLDNTLLKERYTAIKEDVDTLRKKVNEKMKKLNKVNNVNMDFVSEILNFTRDIYTTYTKAPEHLQKKFIGFFFDSFEVKDGIIIEERHSPLFKELVRLEAITYKETESDPNAVIKIVEHGDYVENLHSKYLGIKSELEYTA